MGVHPGMPKIKLGVVDVREAAHAHLKAIEVEEAANQRFILSGKTMWLTEIAQLLHTEFNPLGYKFKPKELAYCLTKFVGFFNSDVKAILPMWGKNYELDNKKSIEILGTEYRPPDESLVEMVYCMIEEGWIPDKRKKK